jgi:hypothetical protein
MPYLDITNQDDLLHLLQLYYAAHPQERAAHDHVRRQSGMAGAYFVAPADAPRLMRWARDRHLVTRKAAADYREVCRTMLNDDAEA